MQDVRRGLCALLVAVLLAALLLPGVASAGVWNPFAEDGNFLDEVRGRLQGLLQQIENLAERVVSRYLLPDPSRLGFRSAGAYRAPQLGLTAPPPTVGLRAVIVPSPKPGETTGTKDVFWAADCSCVKSTGAAPGTTYDVGNRCPDNRDLPCEACKAITRHDNQIRTSAECRTHHFGDD